jgi:hypothetical protein
MTRHIAGALIALATAGLIDAPQAQVAQTADRKPRVFVLTDIENEPERVMPPGTGTMHIILAVTDDGTPPLTRYERLIVTVAP